MTKLKIAAVAAVLMVASTVAQAAEPVDGYPANIC